VTTEDRIQKKREKAGYESKVTHPASIDWETVNEELNKAQQNIDISLRDSNDYDELELNFVTGIFQTSIRIKVIRRCSSSSRT
jgi:hypothetical protein